ncbi:uncharacterized protein LOC124913331 [Impatiens glandulifera]|uniref:uncharacterized protein LOC124913331 n=1 Tax=Impatiens glandulifera TaxID=253017 RepID=UPI001FB139F2|nr:uncharacterized protein LOC124913331 [Impatiens glandulifera]
MRKMIQANGTYPNHTNNNHEGGSQQPAYKHFMSFKPCDFNGSTDPMVAEEWIRSLETKFEFMQCNNSDRLRCATFMFKDDARIWWQGAKSTLNLDTATWEEFKAVFYVKYFTLNTRNKLDREFLEIRQGDISVAEYVKKFERGKYFAPMITGRNDIELNHFLEGLNATIGRDVRLSNAATMRETIDKALMAEKYTVKEHLAPSTSTTAVTAKRTPYSRPANQANLPTFPCNLCGIIHTGPCLQSSNVCFQCKKAGHYKRDCPQLRKVIPGRVYSMNEKKVNPNSTIITGNFLIANKLAITLIDTGGTNSFISAFFVQQAGLKPVESMAVYKISLPAGPSLKTNRFVKACETQLQNHKMFVHLVVVEMSGFDIILGMNWLLCHEAQINCKDKSVTLVDHDGKAFLFQAQ